MTPMPQFCKGTCSTFPVQSFVDVFNKNILWIFLTKLSNPEETIVSNLSIESQKLIYASLKRHWTSSPFWLHPLSTCYLLPYIKKSKCEQLGKKGQKTITQMTNINQAAWHLEPPCPRKTNQTTFVIPMIITGPERSSYA